MAGAGSESGQAEWGLLVAEINRLRLVLVAPERYRRRPNAAIDRAALIELADAVEAEWTAATDDAALRKLRLSLPGRLRRLGIEPPDLEQARLASGEMMRHSFDPRVPTTLVRRKVLDGLRGARRLLRAAWLLAEAAELVAALGGGGGGSPRGPLDPDAIRGLAEIAVNWRLERDLLIPDAALSGRLPVRRTPLDQHVSDLIVLNGLVDTPAASAGALLDWLKQAQLALEVFPELARVTPLVSRVEAWSRSGEA